MKILVAWPPIIPSYFNAGHRMAMYQLAEHLRTSFSEAKIDALDFGALNYTWKEVADTLIRGYDVVVVQNDLDAVVGFGRFIKYCREISPSSKILTFGRLSSLVPTFFEQYRLDGIAQSGDPELCIAEYIRQLQKGDGVPVPGLRTSQAGLWISEPGSWLEADEWSLPNPVEIPFDAYHRLYARDANRFCGIPNRAELVIPMARGCPVGCYFCEVPGREGAKDRRISPERLIRYASSVRNQYRYDYVAMYAPTFTLRESWVRELCALLQSDHLPFKWKCTTTLSHLSEDLVFEMARAGCVRISVGLESAEDTAQKLLPSLKRTPLTDVFTASQWCTRFGIELTCFIVLGIPGTSATKTHDSVTRMKDSGIRVRPTIYCDYSRLHLAKTEEEIDGLNRTLLDGSLYDARDRDIFYQIYYGELLPSSTVAARIPVTSSR